MARCSYITSAYVKEIRESSNGDTNVWLADSAVNNLITDADMCEFECGEFVIIIDNYRFTIAFTEHYNEEVRNKLVSLYDGDKEIYVTNPEATKNIIL